MASQAARDPALLRRIFDAQVELVAAIDRELRLVTANRAYHRAFERLFGRPIRLGQSLSVALGHVPKERTRVEAAWRRALDGEMFRTVESVGHGVGRSCYEASFQPLRDSAGRIEGAFVIARDVTAREQALDEARRLKQELASAVAERTAELTRTEAELARERSAALAMLERLSDGFVALDDEGRVTYINPEARRHLSRPRDRLVGTRIWEVDPSLAAVESELARAAADGFTRDLEVAVDTTRGRRIISVRIHPGTGGFSLFCRDVTGQRSVEESLRTSEAFLRATLDSLDANIAILDEEGVIVAVNEAWRRFGRDNGAADTFVGWSYLDVTDRAASLGEPFAPEAADGLRDILEERSAGFRLDYPCPTGEGDVRWYNLHATRFASPGSAIDGDVRSRIVVKHIDITPVRAAQAAEQRLAVEEAARAEAEAGRQRLVTVLESITDGFVAFDRTWRFTYVNRRAERALRNSRDEVLGRELWALYPEIRGTRLEAVLRTVADAGEPLEEELSPGRDRWYRVAAYPSRDGVSVYFHEVTAHRRAEEALRRSERLLKSVITVLPVGVGIIDLERRVLLANDAGRRIWGAAGDWPRQFEAYRGWWADSGEPIAPNDWALARALDHGATSMGELVTIEGFDGTRKTILNAAVPLLEDGRVVGAIAVHEDVTAMQDKELALRDALRARDHMLGIVSHDLRNPLHAIALSARLLLQSSPSPEQVREAASRIELAVGTLKRLTGDLLDAASLNSGRLTLQRSHRTAAELVADAARRLGAEAEEADVTLETELEEGLPVVWVDHERIQQVFANLGGNALKFTPRGGRLTLRAMRRGRAVAFQVQDDGPGICPDELAHVFEPYWQGSATDRRGRGLGLTIARAIVEAHEGHIEATSTLGGGSCFTFVIPAAAPRVGP